MKTKNSDENRGENEFTTEKSSDNPNGADLNTVHITESVKKIKNKKKKTCKDDAEDKPQIKKPSLAENIEIAPNDDKFPRTKLLLSALQMIDEGYPMPLRGDLQARFQRYVFSKKSYAPVTDHSPMFAVDCEMCRTSINVNELTRISIANEKLEIIYETLVMPSNKIVDYLTQYSGITPELMASVTKNLRQVQKDLRKLLPPDAILVGQSLNSDLNALKMMHPYVIDTGIIFNLTGKRRWKSKLKTLAMTFLGESIQENEDGHDPGEDSLASMKLVKIKLQKGLEFGDKILSAKLEFNKSIPAKTIEYITTNSNEEKPSDIDSDFLNKIKEISGLAEDIEAAKIKYGDFQESTVSLETEKAMKNYDDGKRKANDEELGLEEVTEPKKRKKKKKDKELIAN